MVVYQTDDLAWRCNTLGYVKKRVGTWLERTNRNVSNPNTIPLLFDVRINAGKVV